MVVAVMTVEPIALIRAHCAGVSWLMDDMATAALVSGQADRVNGLAPGPQGPLARGSRWSEGFRLKTPAPVSTSMSDHPSDTVELCESLNHEQAALCLLGPCSLATLQDGSDGLEKASQQGMILGKFVELDAIGVVSRSTCYC